MCTVSAIYDYGQSVPKTVWTAPAIDKFVKLIEDAKDFDAETGQPDCEDPTKAQLMKELKKIRKRLKRLEQNAAIAATEGK